MVLGHRRSSNARPPTHYQARRLGVLGLTVAIPPASDSVVRHPKISHPVAIEQAQLEAQYRLVRPAAELGIRRRIADTALTSLVLDAEHLGDSKNFGARIWDTEIPIPLDSTNRKPKAAQ